MMSDRERAIRGMFGSVVRYEIAAWICRNESPYFNMRQLLEGIDGSVRNVTNPQHLDHLRQLGMVTKVGNAPARPVVTVWQRTNSPLWQIIKVAEQVFGPDEGEHILKEGLRNLADRLSGVEAC